jgi:hypothetical protein
VTHRRRIDLLLDFDRRGGEIFFAGAWGTVVSGVPTDGELPVVAEPMPAGPDAGRWRSVSLLCRPDATPVRSEEAATVAVDEARLGIFDVEAVGAWEHDEALDGRADYVFWGRDAAAAACTVGASPLEDGQFGWLDLPVEEAVERGTRVEEIREERGLKFAVDFRPHSHHYEVMKQVRAGPTDSGTVEVGGTQTCTFMTSWGAGVFRVYRELDAGGRLVQVHIDLGNEETVKRIRSLGGGR